MLIGFIFHSLATSSNNSYFLGKASIGLRFWLKMMRWEAAHLLSWCYRAAPFAMNDMMSLLCCLHVSEVSSLAVGHFNAIFSLSAPLSTAGFPEDPALSLRQTHYRPLQVAAQLTVYVKFFCYSWFFALCLVLFSLVFKISYNSLFVLFWFSGKRCACAWKTDTSSEIFHCCRLDFCRRKTMLS